MAGCDDGFQLIAEHWKKCIHVAKWVLLSHYFNVPIDIHSDTCNHPLIPTRNTSLNTSVVRSCDTNHLPNKEPRHHNSSLGITTGPAYATTSTRRAPSSQCG